MKQWAEMCNAMQKCIQRTQIENEAAIRLE